MPSKPAVADAPVTEFKLLPIGDIAPSPLNPRKLFDEASLQELADSIREHGLQQPVCVRRREPQPDRYDYGLAPANDAAKLYSILDNGALVAGKPAVIARVTGIDAASDWVELLNTAPYELIMGERHYRACKLAGLTSIPAMVHVGEVDDRRHLELALIENLQRKDIDPVEAAQGYAELARMGHTHAQIAAKIGLSEPSIANAIRLLTLPQSILRLVQEGKLGATHARALIRYAHLPLFLEAIGPVVSEKRLTTHELEKGLPHDILDELTRMGPTVLKSLSSHYELHETCKKCPFNAFVQDANGWNKFCAKPTHLKELKKEIAAAKKAEEEKALAKVGISDPKACPKLTSLRGGSYSQISTPPPAGCGSACVCRGQAMDYYDKVVPICTDPKRYNALLKADQDAQEAKLRVEMDQTHEKVMALIQCVSTLEEAAALLLFLTEEAFRIDGKMLTKVAKDLRITAKKHGAGPEIGELGQKRGLRARLAPLDLIKLAVGALCESEYSYARQYTYRSITRMKQLLADQKLVKTVTPPAAALADNELERYIDCPDCKGNARLKTNRDTGAELYACGCGWTISAQNHVASRRAEHGTREEEPVPA
jgi:ParB-like chromosome segregation protein Spo0J